MNDFKLNEKDFDNLEKLINPKKQKFDWKIIINPTVIIACFFSLLTICFAFLTKQYKQSVFNYLFLGSNLLCYIYILFGFFKCMKLYYEDDKNTIKTISTKFFEQEKLKNDFYNEFLHLYQIDNVCMNKYYEYINNNYKNNEKFNKNLFDGYKVVGPIAMIFLFINNLQKFYEAPKTSINIVIFLFPLIVYIFYCFETAKLNRIKKYRDFLKYSLEKTSQ